MERDRGVGAISSERTPLLTDYSTDGKGNFVQRNNACVSDHSVQQNNVALSDLEGHDLWRERSNLLLFCKSWPDLCC